MISGLACPVVVVPYDWPGFPAGRLPVLVALDTETDAHELVSLAFDQAARWQSGVVALHLLDSRPVPATTDQHRARLAALVTAAQRAHPGLPVRLRVLAGRPDEEIVRLSSGMGLVVVGWPHHQRRWPWSRSVAAAVVDRMRCPIVVFPQPIIERSPKDVRVKDRA